MKYLLFLLLLLPLPVLATSGACSYHGGVNCGVESYDGSAICNDGWKSSVDYSQINECTVSNCQYPIARGCTSDSDLETQQAIEWQLGRTGSAQSEAQIITCQDQINTYTSQLNSYNTCVSRISNPQVLFPNCSPNGYFNTQSNTCVCNSGYLFNVNHYCIPAEQECQNELGSTGGWSVGAQKCIVFQPIPVPTAVSTFQPVYPSPIVVPSTSPTITVVPSVPPKPPTFTSPFKIGSSDKQVSKLQSILIKLHYLKIQATGYFGTATQAALKLFQKGNGLKVNGTVDTPTIKVLNELVI